VLGVGAHFLGARASKFCTMVTNTHMFSVFNLLYVALLASRIYVAHRFFKNLCVSDLGQIAHLGARSICFQHKVIHLNKKMHVSNVRKFIFLWHLIILCKNSGEVCILSLGGNVINIAQVAEMACLICGR
jgi:hypothetical protein